jgi:DedD protein
VNRSLNTDLDDPHQDEPSSADREISLGVPTILGIFFALALVCACIFGFGYTLGRKSGQNAANAAILAPTNSSVTVKPAPGSVAGDPAPVRLPATAPPAETVTQPVDAPAPVAGNGATAANATTAADPRPAAAPPAPAVAPSGTFMVQIAAVSSQDIADIEVAALKKYGYDVVIRHEPTDQLLHVQIGPYATRKEAEAMRQNILAHGFNAIVK